ncbi:MAG TPA: EF-hand domain-containing protein [Syntrophorhabdaceae bacterium]|nr:EF-hand domain-containing protein [Syntrophorhabdaceae bacterium]HOL04799.1 EF-hand domain-containing protein [Syntrophorhabdaceae bacterium]HON85590.1 EF-hand domain-containing protein [Syntrophorhabdaceae bacterium]HOT42400.1 EF-hand domain-containing protein [Syntrophorhabdaceae bacterium]HPC65898.1 EF-hand domain-containing protein [Syntrophorhabdaceae bacterium]
MKRFLIITLALLIGIAFTSPGFAQTKPAAPEKPAPEKAAPAKAEPAAPEKPAKPEAAKEAEKPKPKPVPGFEGTVEKIESGLLTLKYKKGVITFDVTNAKFKGYKGAEDIKVGDKVSVRYIKGAMTVTKIAGAKPAPVKKAKKGFKDIDTNNDGKITIEELTIVFVNITPEDFKKFDKNNDGSLDEKEFKAIK